MMGGGGGCAAAPETSSSVNAAALDKSLVFTILGPITDKFQRLNAIKLDGVGIVVCSVPATVPHHLAARRRAEGWIASSLPPFTR
jgi:hypothetical protein